MTTKVFVGNLSFKTNADKLKSEFQSAGNVVGANIISRGPRSLGYGFVELATPEAAVKAVEMFNQKDIDGRTVNVEVARPRVEKPAGEQQEEGDGEFTTDRRRRRRYRPQQQQLQQQPQQQYQQHRVRQYRPRQNLNVQANGQQTDNYNNTGYRRNYNRGFKFNRYRRANNNTNTTTGNRQPRQQQQQQQPQHQQQRRAPQPRPVIQRKPQNRVPSKTTLFVANLPFAVTDAELAEIFSKNLKVASAHVVKKRNDRSKGFGFVEFETEADQQTALKEFEGFVVHERPINVKIALTVVPSEAGSEAGQAPVTDNAAAATTATTTTTTTAESSKPAEETKPIAEEAKPAAVEVKSTSEVPASEENKAQ